MAICSIRYKSELGPDLVLAPERYDPRRKNHGDGIPLFEVCDLVRKTVTSNTEADGKFIVLDTSDAREGIIDCRKDAVSGKDIGSTKKVVPKNSVIISRLRPYLRQVGYADNGIPGWDDDVNLVCSTEFYVLKCKDGEPAAFLVPFLLSNGVQTVLAASQEGGHHPRFNDSTLLNLNLPRELLEGRTEIAETVQEAVRTYRQGVDQLHELIGQFDSEV